MSRLVILSAAAQVANHLRGELMRGAWGGRIPGGDRLAAELGVGCNTVEAALQLLEKEGLLANQGRGRGRRIVQPAGGPAARQIRVAILCAEATNRRLDYMIEIQHQLAAAGYRVQPAPRSMMELGMNAPRIVRMVEATEADAWVVIAGSLEVLEWFAAREIPAFAVFGRRRGLALAGAGPDKASALAEATRELLALGHRRIVLLTRPRQRLPLPGVPEQTFLDTLAAHGIAPGAYHLPDWDETLKGFSGRLEGLFQATPPTALILDEVGLFVATLDFCANRGLRVPADVSLVCNDPDPIFALCQPSVAHIRWNSTPLARRIVRWAEGVGHGRADRRQTLIPAVFIRGGTIGPAKAGKIPG